jgi:hypothetical protein
MRSPLRGASARWARARNSGRPRPCRRRRAVASRCSTSACSDSTAFHIALPDAGDPPATSGCEVIVEGATVTPRSRALGEALERPRSIGTVVLGALIYSERITPPKLISFVSIIYGAILFELAAGA